MTGPSNSISTARTPGPPGVHQGTAHLPGPAAGPRPGVHRPEGAFRAAAQPASGQGLGPGLRPDGTAAGPSEPGRAVGRGTDGGGLAVELPEDPTATLELTVRERREESDGVVSLTLVDPAGRTLPVWRPGAHIDVHVDGHVRQYSLCSPGGDQGGGSACSRRPTDAADHWPSITPWRPDRR